MLNLSVDGDMYVININLPRSSFNEELLTRVVGLTYKTKTSVSSTYRSKNIQDIHQKTERLLNLFKILDYGTR